jgi:hypothetical protein
MLQQDQKNIEAKIANVTQSEITAKLLDHKMLGAIINCVNSSFKSKKGEELQL